MEQTCAIYVEYTFFCKPWVYVVPLHDNFHLELDSSLFWIETFTRAWVITGVQIDLVQLVMVHPKVFFLGFFLLWGDFGWPIIIFLIETLGSSPTPPIPILCCAKLCTCKTNTVTHYNMECKLIPICHLHSHGI